MRAWPVSTRENRPENDNPSILEPATDAAQLVGTAIGAMS
jgi:hypothetical protein